MITVCIPVLKRYDLLSKLLTSLRESTIRPAISIVDNGRNEELVSQAVAESPLDLTIYIPKTPMGLAQSWNWFIDHVPEERLITNDDITFAPGSLAAMLEPSDDFVSCTFGFSCFVIRDGCVDRVGRFDEDISPGYAYFEDMDYLRRMRVASVTDAVVRCGVEHAQSATIEKYTPKELDEHHIKFTLAKKNYKAKWGEAPDWDELREIGGAGANS